jgi:hypothetical protein
VWESTVNGQVLTFRLAGINNQNFIMRDDETGTWWQQVTGKAIHGPLKGYQLKSVFHDDISFAIWKREKPRIGKRGSGRCASSTVLISTNDLLHEHS